MKFFFTLLLLSTQFFFSLTVFAEEQWFVVEPVKREVTIVGYTRAESTMPLATEVEGKISKVFADMGDPIPATEKFACIDDTFTKIDIKSARNEMSQHSIDIKYFNKEVVRHEQLVRKQTSSVSVLDGLKRNLANAKQALNFAAIRKQRLEEYRRRHCINAPKGWLVIDKNIEVGQWVNQGDVLAHIGNYSQLKVPLRLSQKELATLQKNPEKIELLLMDFNKKVPAVIDHISPAFDEKTRKILVDLLIKEISSELHGGMRVGLMLNMPGFKNTSFMVSSQALEERFEEYWMHRKDGKSIRVKLLNESVDGQVIVSSDEIKVGDNFKKIVY